MELSGKRERDMSDEKYVGSSWMLIGFQQHGCSAMQTFGPVLKDGEALEVVPAFERNVLANALRAITTAGDASPFAEAYQAAGGGYEGLQAVAQQALGMLAK